MNPLSAPPARFACRVIRLGRALTESSRAPTEQRRFGSRHIARCAACQEFFRHGEALERSLRGEACALVQTLPAGLDQRIITVIRAAATHRVKRRAFPMVGAALSAAAALVLLGLWILRPIPPRNVDRHETIAGDVGTARGFAAPQLLDRFWNSLPESADTLLDRNPLRKEADAVYADARSAVQFLALNFLPTTTAGPPSPADPSRRDSAGG